MRIAFALLSLILGAVLVFGGYRLARVVIPLWGFLTGLALGGAIIADLSSMPFLGTVLGVLTGLVVGVAFALLAYLYYSAAVIILAGMLGYWAGSGLLILLGFNPGVLSTIAGIAVGVVAGVLAVVANAPKWVLIVFTAGAGAIATIGGLLLLFNAIPLDTFSYTAAKATISDSAWWTIVALVLAAIGIFAQARTTSDYFLAQWAVGDHNEDDRMTHHHTTHPTFSH